MPFRTVASFLAVTLLAVGCGDAADAPTSITAPEARLSGLRAACELGVSDTDARTAIDEILDELDELQGTGALNRGQATALRNKLDHALRHIDAERLCPALAQLRAFRGQAHAFVKAGTLTESEAAPLLDRVEFVLSGPPSRLAFEAIGAGENFTCGLVASGAAYCWGMNTAGHLGDGTTTDRHVPTPVSGGHAFVSISAGLMHTCAIEANGDAYCWGSNSSGQLGDGTTTGRLVPTAVSGEHAFVSINVGSAHTCGLEADGDAYCWGGNALGQLGHGMRTSQSTVPTLVSGGHEFASISAGWYHTCALESDGDAYCWGGNIAGELGDGTTTTRQVPGAVEGGHAFASIGAGWYRSCGLESDGDAFCWGVNVGDGTTTDRHVPTSVAGGHAFSSISVGWVHTCGLEADGDAYCWGSNLLGELGDGTTTSRHVPTAVSGEHAFASISLGWTHTCALEADGAAYCWGGNARGSIGDGTTTNRHVPTAVVGSETHRRVGVWR